MNLNRSPWKLEVLRTLAAGPTPQQDLVGRNAANDTKETRRRGLQALKTAGLADVTTGDRGANIWAITPAGRVALAKH